jgi:hypothetical protein
MQATGIPPHVSLLEKMDNVGEGLTQVKKELA